MTHTRSEVSKIVYDLAHALEDNQSPHYALGYLRVVIEDLLMDLSPDKHNLQVRWLKQALTKELEIQQDRKDAA